MSNLTSEQKDARKGNGEFGALPPKPEAETGVKAAFSVSRVRNLRSMDSIRASDDEIEARQTQLTSDEYDNGREGLIAAVTARYPGVVDIEIYNSLADEGETLYSVSEIRGRDGVYWEAGDDDFGLELDEWSSGLDRYGMDHLLNPADRDHGNSWNGIVAVEDAEHRSLEDIRESAREIRARERQLTEDEFQIGAEGLITAVAIRYPGATEIHVYNSLEDDGESLYHIDEIRGESGVFWTSGDDYFDEECEEWSVRLDRFGMSRLMNDADADHAQPWTGLKTGLR